MQPPIPFIVGCGRSGTTLLRSILDSHADLAIPGENEFLLAEFKRATPFTRGEQLPSAQIEELLKHYPTVHATLAVPLEGTPQHLTLSDWVHHSYRLYAEGFGKSRFGDKTPGLVLYLERLADVIPDAVFIHLIRDGRDVAEAFLAHAWGPRTIGQAASAWREHVCAGRAAGLRLPHHRYLELRYEDLVDDPEASIRAVCDFIALDFNPAMLDFRASATRARKLSRFPESHRNLDRPPTRELRNWRRDMSAARRISFETRVGSLLEACGYHPPLLRVVARRVSNVPAWRVIRRFLRRRTRRRARKTPS